MNDNERQYLLAVERGEMNTVKEMLDKKDELNLDVNCCDPLARDALIIAIDNENLEIIKLLLEARVELGDALLYAIEENFVEAVELLLDYQQSQSISTRQWHEDSFFSADMSPLILAAHRNNFEIIKMLLDRKVPPIADPHDPRCDCTSCCRARNEDCLKHSRSRINAYRALASPCLMALSSPDPLLAAFNMSEKLENLAKMEPEYKEDYLRLRSQCQLFATRLMDHTRTSKELEILLNYSDESIHPLEDKSSDFPSSEDETTASPNDFECVEMSLQVPKLNNHEQRSCALTPQVMKHSSFKTHLTTCSKSNNLELSSMNEFMEADTRRRRIRMIQVMQRSEQQQSQSKQQNRSLNMTNSVQSVDSVTGRHEFYQSSRRLARLKLAIQCKQKTFCAHPNIQELLATMWYENLPGFRRKNFLAQAVQVICIGLMFPIYSIAYLLAPHSQLGRYIKKPFIKFICHSASYITFLIVLILASQRVEAFYSWSSVLDLVSTLTLSQQQRHRHGDNLTDLWAQTSKRHSSMMAAPPADLSALDVNSLAALYKQYGDSASGARSLDSLTKIFGELPASSKKRGTLPSPIETMIVIWVFSLIWAEIKQIKLLGMNYYKHDMWNILDSVASGFYIGAIILRIVSYCIADEKTMEEAREHWNAYDPTLLSEGLFATATIFSALKLVYIFSLNPYLGPLQISLGRMIIDILRFSWIYLLVLFAFACGMNQLLWYYADLERHQCLNATNYSLAQYYSGLKLQSVSGASNATLLASNTTAPPIDSKSELTTETSLLNDPFDDDSSKPPVTIDDSCKTWRHFSNVFESSQTLFWANFGLVDLENFDLTGIRQYTRFWALLMFGCYCFINVIVVLNLLIAMMNHSYVKISKRSDVEWKFARTRLWMSYFDSGSTVPAPFNIVPSLKSIKYLFRYIARRCCCADSQQSKCDRVHHQLVKQNCLSMSYREVIRSLVRRYLVHEQRILEKKRELTEAKLNRWAKWGQKEKFN